MNILSAGFNFDDEIPDGLTESPDPFRPPTALLRSLWVYRLSPGQREATPRPCPHLGMDGGGRAPQWAGLCFPIGAPRSSSRLSVRSGSETSSIARDIEPLEARIEEEPGHREQRCGRCRHREGRPLFDRDEMKRAILSGRFGTAGSPAGNGRRSGSVSRPGSIEEDL